MGEKEYVAAVLNEKVDQIVSEARTALERLQQHRQAAWVALKCSIWSRFEYWASLCYPSDSIPVAQALDNHLWRLLEEVCGFSILHQGLRGADTGESTISSPEGLREGWSFAAWVARQPVKLGGMGLRSLGELCRPAFLGAMEQALPRLHRGTCPHCWWRGGVW